MSIRIGSRLIAAGAAVVLGLLFIACGRGNTSPAAAAQRHGDLLIAQETGLYLRDLGSGPERLLIAAQNGQRIINPAWAPDGSQFAYVLEVPAAGPSYSPGPPSDDLYVADAIGQHVQLVLPHTEAGALVSGLSWTPDGKQLIFTSVRSSGAQVRRLDLASHNVSTVLDTDPGVVPCSTGARLAYAGGDLRVTDAAGQADTQVATPAPNALTEIRGVRFSPDCTRLVFEKFERIIDNGPFRGHVQAQGTWSLWVVNADGTAPRQLQSLQTGQIPSSGWVWSRDGQALLSLNADGLYRQPADGGQQVRVGSGGSGEIAWRQR